ncbi:MAG: prepilin-type N-terminal cleavage/methylation domain-containing protein [Campylobacterales bacterium]|nr:prepilin-type N-terminal cleavage/methylation domain-containing protein [Campylobacterales bacterium]
MRAISSASKAFTLIEMLVSILLMSMIVATMMYAFKDALMQTMRIGTPAPHSALVYHQLRTLIDAAFPYVTIQSGTFNTQKTTYTLYFTGHEQYLRFVSEHPLLAKQGLSLCEVRCDRNRLLYYETPLFNDKQNFNAPKLPDHTLAKILMDKLDSCRFAVSKSDEKANLLPKLIELEIGTANDTLRFAFHPRLRFDNVRMIRVANQDAF